MRVSERTIVIPLGVLTKTIGKTIGCKALSVMAIASGSLVSYSMPFNLAQQSTEETIVLCQGNQRHTARVYLSNNQIMLRLYDRQDSVVWMNTAATQSANSEVNIYSNQQGETIVKVAVSRSATVCSIQVGSQPLEAGTVLAGAATEPFMSDVPSPVGGTVKQVTIPGPEVSVLVTCDRAGFKPFFFTDQGNWVGCQLSDGATPDSGSELTEPILTDVASPVGGTVKQVTIPGPEVSVLVTCDRAGFKPFFFTDQGNWVGCTGD